MSAVIEFPAGRTRPVVQTGNADSAQVIIFPGVRIERLKYDLAERLPIMRNGSTAQPSAGEFEFN